MPSRSQMPLQRDDPWHLAEGQDEGALWLAWLVRLRWVAIIGQLVTLSFSVSVLHQPGVTASLLLGAVGVLGVANFVALRHLRTHETVSGLTLLSHLAFDVLVLTVFFVAAGGAKNPFVMLYVIHVAMAGVMMRRRDAMALIALVIVANIGLHLYALPLHLEQHTLSPATLVAAGQTIALTVTVVSVGTFILGMAATLRRQKQRLMEARDRTARTDRLRSVGTLAAGAAHELNTPLSTMGLRLRRIKRRFDDADTVRDVEVIQNQLDRCTTIVEQLLVGAGDPSASGLERTDLNNLVESTLNLWSKGTTLEFNLTRTAEDIPVELPPVAFRQALINLLENAREAQEEIECFDPLDIRVLRGGGVGTVEIVDHGPGLPEDGQRVGEPFFTTKDTGTGLGVFVARAVADGAGGGLAYERDQDRTTTRWWFPETGRNG